MSEKPKLSFKYNAKKRSNEKIHDYYEHIRNGKQEKPFYEAVDFAKHPADDVNFERISLDNVNVINETLEYLTGRHPINRLENQLKFTKWGVHPSYDDNIKRAYDSRVRSYHCRLIFRTVQQSEGKPKL